MKNQISKGKQPLVSGPSAITPVNQANSNKGKGGKPSQPKSSFYDTHSNSNKGGVDKSLRAKGKATSDMTGSF